MDPVLAFERHATAFRSRFMPALRIAFWAAALLSIVTAGAVARGGTLLMRGLAAGLWVVVVAAFLARALFVRRTLRRHDRLVRRLILAEDRVLGEKVLRALELKERAEREPGVGSAELVDLHLARTVGRIPETLVAGRAQRVARRFRVAAVVMALAGLVGLALDPARIIEGLDVLVARRGVAPLEMVWLEGLTVLVQPPPYLRSPEHHLELRGDSAPEGSTLVVRGVPVRPGRRLVLTDGKTEVPFTTDGSAGEVARFTLSASTTLRVAARFGDVLVHEPEPLDVQAVPDTVPMVVLEGAPRQLELAELDRLDLRYLAVDDHGLREIDLVLRSGGREERRVLEKLDGQSRVEQGAQALDAGDAFVRRMFLPISVTIEARDNDVLEGGRWGQSQPITIVPPAVGAPEAARFKVLAGARGALVDFLGWLVEPREPSDAKADAAELKRRRAEAVRILREAAERQPSGEKVPKRLASFVLGQARRLEESGRSDAALTERAEDVVLAVDTAIRSLAIVDAQSVAKRLGDAAEEAADGFLLAQNPERTRSGNARATQALGVLDVGAENLGVLEGLGVDLGSVTRGELRRIRRATDSKSYLHAELAARHLAARLRRPTPSFAAAGGGVEGGGHGAPRPPSSSPSRADQAFDQLAQELGDLTREHAALLDQVDHDLENAGEAAKTEDMKREAAEHAQALRDAVRDLPASGAREGSARAAAGMARDHALAMAERIERLELDDAAESGRTARGQLDEAQRKALAPQSALDLLDQNELGRARGAVERELAWAERQREQMKRDTAERARQKLAEAAERERSIERRLGEVSERAEQSEAALPKAALDKLGQARAAMKSAANELGSGRGEAGLTEQREAQRLLEQGGSDPTNEEGNRASRERPTGDQRGGRGMETRAPVPGADDQHRALEFRKRVLEGLGKERGGRLDPAVRRYAEGLLE